MAAARATLQPDTASGARKQRPHASSESAIAEAPAGPGEAAIPAAPRPTHSPARLAALERELIECRRCPRLVAWREQVARERRPAFAQERYWGRPVPGFGDPRARLLVMGLAPAAHGANRTGRMFTGDRSGEFLFAALARAGLANQARSEARDDGLRLDGVWVSAAVRCAPPGNRPTPLERARCAPWSERELDLLRDVGVIVCLGAIAWQAALHLLPMREQSVPAGRAPTRPRFAHGAELIGERYTLLGCYHPSQQNTFTGRLTETMIDAVFARAKALAARREASAPRRPGKRDAGREDR